MHVHGSITCIFQSWKNISLKKVVEEEKWEKWEKKGEEDEEDKEKTGFSFQYS